MSNSKFHCGDQAGCSNGTAMYRQCPDNNCKHEIGYCGQHGGDQRAQDEMVEHIKQHRESP